MMFTFYDTSNGKVLFVSDLQSEDNASNIAAVTEGSSYVSGEYPSDLYVFNDGQPVMKSDDDLAAEASNIAWMRMKDVRNSVLSQCDWTQMPDSPLTDEQKQAWATYRQALRDLPENTADPRNPTWPTKPE